MSGCFPAMPIGAEESPRAEAAGESSQGDAGALKRETELPIASFTTAGFLECSAASENKLTAEGNAVIRKLGLGLAGLMLAAALGVELAPANAYAAKVDCAKVMAEVNAGKKPTAIAKDLGISTSSVYRCKKKMAKAAKTTTTTKSTTPASPAMAASPAK